MVLFAYLGGLLSNIGNNAEEYTVSGSLLAREMYAVSSYMGARLTWRSRGTQANMAVWAWPVEGWEVLAGDDDDLSEEAEHAIAAAEAEGDPQEDDADVNGANFLGIHFGDAY